MRRGRGVTPPSVERSFGLPYTFGLFELSPLSRDVPARGAGEAGGGAPVRARAPCSRTHRLL